MPVNLENKLKKHEANLLDINKKIEEFNSIDKNFVSKLLEFKVKEETTIDKIKTRIAEGK